MKTLVVLAAVLGLAGCTVLPPQPMTHTPEFAPVIPAARERAPQATGSIYHSRISDNFFGRGRNYQVGDVITVILNESTQAARTANTEVNRKSANDVIPMVPTNRLRTMGGILGGTDVRSANISSTGKGTADQQASLEGAVAVTVVDVLANGNLVLRGEKQLALTEGAEVIQVAGVIRPEDVAPNNTVQSRRLANAQITYRGTGDLAAASKPGWGTGLLLKLWPF
jgi:flagellar L-ring protein precursor FlgH